MTVYGLAVLLLRTAGVALGLRVLWAFSSWAVYGLHASFDTPVREYSFTQFVVSLGFFSVLAALAGVLVLRGAWVARWVVPSVEDRLLSDGAAVPLVALLVRLAAVGIMVFELSVMASWLAFAVVGGVSDAAWAGFWPAIVACGVRAGIAWGLWALARPIAVRVTAGVEAPGRNEEHPRG